MFFVNSINRFIKSGEKRSVQVKTNIAISFFVKGLSISINFSLVPLTIEYVNPSEYGIWLTLTSVISWFTFFDFGMGNGLRNKLATALALNDYDTAKKYISTTYAIFTVIALLVFILFSFVNPYINWNHFLNISDRVDDNIHLILFIVLGMFSVQFVMQVLNTVLTALQQPAKAEFITLIGQAAVLTILIILKNTSKGSLDVLVFALNGTPIAIMFLASIFLYRGKLRMIAPSFKHVHFKYSKDILNLGLAFFFIQIGALILFQTDNIIISRILGPEAVTKFNVTYKLYSVIVIVFSVIVMPYWSAFTDAYAKNDFAWVGRSVKRLREIWLFTSFIIIPLFFLSAKILFKLWLPTSVEISLSLSLCMAIYSVGYTCLMINCYFLNGIGKLKIQLYLYIIVVLTNVPMGIAMGKKLGIEGVIISNIFSFILMNIVLWIQTNKLIKQSASGIWNA